MNKESKTILLVEDEPPTIKLIAEKFEEEGFIVNVATNGEEGLAMALGTKPDLILLDIIMPKMDGISMLRELRKEPWGESAKVIILTNLSDPDQFAEADCLKVSDYLIKTNWKLTDLVRIVEDRLKES